MGKETEKSIRSRAQMPTDIVKSLGSSPVNVGRGAVALQPGHGSTPTRSTPSGFLVYLTTLCVRAALSSFFRARTPRCPRGWSVGCVGGRPASTPAVKASLYPCRPGKSSKPPPGKGSKPFPWVGFALRTRSSHSDGRLTWSPPSPRERQPEPYHVATADIAGGTLTRY